MDFRSLFNPKKLDELETQQYRAGIIALVGLIALMAISGLVAFFLALEGEEKTLVPDVSNLELSTALVKLQEKELYPRISLRFSEDPETRGRILEQNPRAGSIVKAGRRIALVVSRGAAQDKVGDYVGQSLDEVTIHLQTVFGASRQLITVAEPSVYKWDKAAAGTILEQEPDPDTELSGPIQLRFVVSRGPEKAKVTVPELVGQSLESVSERIKRAGIAFVFTMRPKEGKEAPGTVVAQLPAPGTAQDALTPVNLVYAAPAQTEGMVSGLFSQALPEYPYPLKIVLSAEKPDGSKIELIAVEHPGTLFSYPYNLPVGSVLILQVANRVVARVEAGR